MSEHQDEAESPKARPPLPPVILSPLRDRDYPGWITQDGARIFRAALDVSVKGAAMRQGGAPIAGNEVFVRAYTVLKLIEQGPPPEPRQVFRATLRGSAGGSAVAVDEVRGAESGPVVPGGLSTRAAAEQLGISDRMVRRACVHGWITAVRVRGRWEIPEPEIRAYRKRREAREDERQAAASG
ncbi:helix-turn-helix domain-containing protein [Actinomadura rupiterrae]|uniref:helix-turn-helix domain-containing protein n=1 Tax=Actinomadura rupiterrae TaxID=559627 RepID=UPI0020A3A1B3|nr:helix-turn-helix domain-containing protein [Actinomadura rupiterrae]MCP2336134.1 excisionase family DNA binding protein [Actinomadura rupiterrae]